MVNRLATSLSPYLRAHADNPVDWREWGQDAFDEASARDVPVFISIGYSTCHWCHVMARESFRDPEIAAVLNDNFVSIKVDREEHPGVDASYIAQAAAFTRQLGWPLSIFTTSEGVAFHAGTYYPPVPIQGHPSFRQLLAAVLDAWTNRRTEVLQNARAIGDAIASSPVPEGGALPAPADIDAAVKRIADSEDLQFGGFGAAPKFPVAPAVNFLLDTEVGMELGARTLEKMAASPLRDAVEGGFFRYATQRDWSDPHYERMLYDNAILLDAYATAWAHDPARNWAAETAAGIARFLGDVLQLPSGGFASAQDSESVIDGARSEGGYYARDAAGREELEPPALDEKVLAGWNGLAIGALARAAVVFDRVDWLDSARAAADHVLAHHRTPDGRLVRASVAERRSSAPAALEDYGMLASGLLNLAAATGETSYAVEARALVDDVLTAGDAAGTVFAEPGGGDPILAAAGIVLAGDPSEGAYPSGISSCATAAWRLHSVTGDRRYLDAAVSALEPISELALANPLSFGTSLALLSRLTRTPVQLVVVSPDGSSPAQELPATIRTRPTDVTALVTEQQAAAFAAAGFELFDARTPQNGARVAYLCENFTCRLPEKV
ncbi:thioredoxin domain-containing protein [Mycetocola manganoxydans]|uniref:Thioredoxin domain-containing protein n=1 Tax=Mycetocola manganoxydans TaxID=699879 RepID=A0A3L6ZP48_9MICO|nr:thioredoxin domain-containing protein [Mycetocola manganoxydans]RLP69445.1 thioredoxin domain-containing protein [Mycetocola manganoxydans]GHD50481.1 hypothetical protein GCM10008097_24450 [Mycetocola manganoxydans]